VHSQKTERKKSARGEGKSRQRGGMDGTAGDGSTTRDQTRRVEPKTGKSPAQAIV